jgi:energy-coupling factor transporter ATP-binding protein EcfA2
VRRVSKRLELTAFVSSTYKDLKDCRQKVEEALLRIQSGFRSMRFFGSQEGEPLEQCLAKVKETNYYIGIIGHRYGAVHEPLGLSYTELEYEEAKRLGIPRKIYIADSSVPLLPENIESDSLRAMLRSFKQKLQRENTTVSFSSPDDLATKVLADIQIGIRERNEFSLFARDKYLPAIRKACGSISFLGLDIRAMKRHKDVDLGKVYVEPRFAPVVDQPAIAAGSASLPLLRPDDARYGRARQSLRIKEMISSNNNIVILGDPGSGKSTLAKYLAVGIAEGSPPSASKRLSIPIRVPLRNYAEFRTRSGGVGITILDFIVALTKTELQLDSVPDGFFETYLQSREATVIFDGLDEIFDAYLREQVRNDIVAFAQFSYPGNRIVVTSRKAGYEEAGFPQLDFLHYEVRPFDAAQISEYVNKWYKLEEPEREKRVEEIAAFDRAKRNLPDELLSNPLLLSLIVILFRAGCTLPDSKLEIYRSCVGTLTEKWDAAGKRLEVPPQYNLVRDKKGAFARIAYWMYTKARAAGHAQTQPKYPEILNELSEHLCEREFKNREAEAQLAAESFLDLAARRSIFVEDRFSHKTFHEFFAALYLYRNFCLGRTPSELYSELKQHLSSDYWSVVLELLFMMLDEQAPALLDVLFDHILADVKSSYKKQGSLLPVPLRIIGQIQNLSEDRIDTAISMAADICFRAKVPDLWSGESTVAAEETHQRIFASLERLPEQIRNRMPPLFQKVAAQLGVDADFLPVAIFFSEFPDMRGITLETLVPHFSEVQGDLVQRSLGVFYHMHREDDVDQLLKSFATNVGPERLFDPCRLFFMHSGSYAPIATYVMYRLAHEPEDISEYDRKLERFLSSDFADAILKWSIESKGYVHHPRISVPLQHLSSPGHTSRKYLIDWLGLVSTPVLNDENSVRVLRNILANGDPKQRYFASALLRSAPPAVSGKEMDLPPEIFSALQTSISLRTDHTPGRIRRMSPLRRAPRR